MRHVNVADASLVDRHDGFADRSDHRAENAADYCVALPVPVIAAKSVAFESCVDNEQPATFAFLV